MTSVLDVRNVSQGCVAAFADFFPAAVIATRMRGLADVVLPLVDIESAGEAVLEGDGDEDEDLESDTVGNAVTEGGDACDAVVCCDGVSDFEGLEAFGPLCARFASPEPGTSTGLRGAFQSSST